MSLTERFEEYCKMPYYIFYSQEDRVIAWSSKTEQIKKMTFEEVYDKNYKSYKMIKAGFEATPAGLKLYVEEFHRCVEELKNNKISINKRIIPINWFQYSNNNTAVISTFHRLAKGRYEKDVHEVIGNVEAQWMEKCYKSGIRNVDAKYIGKPVLCYSYDFRLCHPTVMANEYLKVPTKSGKEHTLSKIPELGNLDIGYYHVKITCANKQFSKIFSYSKDHVYANGSLHQAQYYQKDFDVKIELVMDGKPNAYLYDKSCCMTGKEIFREWFGYMIRMKKRIRGNFLVKFLASSLSGELSRQKCIWKSGEKIESEKLDVGFDLNGHDYYIMNYLPDKDLYKLRDCKQPFVYNIRFKPFMTAFVRNKVGRLAMTDLPNTVRVFEDCVSFAVPKEFKLVDLSYEEKSSGLAIYTSTVKAKYSDQYFQYLQEKDMELYDIILNFCKIKQKIK